MKRTNKKGFTIVELVVVIAVIAILAAIMIPTFSGVAGEAQEAARDQEAKSIYSQYLGNWDYQNDGEPVYDGFILVDGYYYTLSDGNIDIENEDDEVPEQNGYTLTQNADCDDLYTFVANPAQNP